jgi:hypothetical protein
MSTPNIAPKRISMHSSSAEAWSRGGAIWLVGGARRWAAEQKLDYRSQELACSQDRASEITMDDLTAELRLRGVEPPYDAVKQELATRARMNEATPKKAGKAFALQIGKFMRESDKPLN